MNTTDSRPTGFVDMNKRMISNNDILYNTFYGDFWWVKWWKNEWVAVLINDGQTEPLKNLSRFSVCGEFNCFDEFTPKDGTELQRGEDDD